jgi:hypothetical protein
MPNPVEIVGTYRATAPTNAEGPAQILTDAAGRIVITSSTGTGAKAPSASLSVVPAGFQYETVAAGQTAQVLGATGAAADYLSHIILQPAATVAGTTTVLDNATVIYTFTTGTLADLRPIIVPIGCFSVSGASKVTTGASMAAVGVGSFT